MATNKIQIKRTTAIANNPTGLVPGELAINLATQPPKLYVGDGTTSLEVGPVVYTTTDLSTPADPANTHRNGSIWIDPTTAGEEKFYYRANNTWVEIEGIDNTRIDVTQANTFTNGQPIYHDGTGWKLAQANADATVGTHVVTEVTAADFVAIQSGYVDTLAGLTAGSYYFVDPATAGGWVTTETTAAGEFSNPLMYALSTTEAWVLPWRASEIDVVSNLLNDLDDVDAPLPAEGDILTYDTSVSPSAWVSSPPGSSTTSEVTDNLDGTYTHNDGDGSPGSEVLIDTNKALDEITDVNVPTPTAGQVLTWDGSSPGMWVAIDPVSNLNDLNDVNIPAPGDGSVLTWDGSSSPGMWVAQPVSTTFIGLTDTPADYTTAPALAGSVPWINAGLTALEWHNLLLSDMADVPVPTATEDGQAIVWDHNGSPPGWVFTEVNKTRDRQVYSAPVVGTTTFAVTYNTVNNGGDVDVYLNGALLIPVVDYASTTGTNIVLTTATTAITDVIVCIGHP